MSIVDMSPRKVCEWCVNTRHLLEHVARELNHHSVAVANMQLAYYERKTCSSVEVYDLYVLLMELFEVIRLKTQQDFDSVDTNHINILNVVLKSYREGYPPPYKKYIN